MNSRKSVFDFYKMKAAGEKVVYITSYDFPTAQFAEAAGVDMILVGDSLGMCVYGYNGTTPVKMDQMIYHAEAVRRGAPNTFVVGDMPFMSYQSSVEKAVENAGRFIKEADVDAIKLEGGKRVTPPDQGYCGRRHRGHGAPGTHPPKLRPARRTQGSGPHRRRRGHGSRGFPGR